MVSSEMSFKMEKLRLVFRSEKEMSFSETCIKLHVFQSKTQLYEHLNCGKGTSLTQV